MTTISHSSHEQDLDIHEAPRKRRKITRACDVCKSRKRRCTGDLPCANCRLAQSVPCTYLASYNRGRPTTPRVSTILDHDSSLLEEGARNLLYVRGYQETPVGEGVINTQFTDQNAVPGVENENHNVVPASQGAQQLTVAAVPSRRPSVDADDMINAEGQYLGSTSAQAFLQRAYTRLCASGPQHQNKREMPSNVPIFAFGDASHPNLEQDSPVCLPTLPVAKSLIDRYFNFASPTYRVLHRQTVDSWYSSMCAGGSTNHLSPVKQAIVYVVFAAATMLNDSDPQDFSTSEKYYVAANERLAAELGSPTLASVQSRFIICQFLLATGRPNKAWFLFGTTVQLIMALGLHRTHRHITPNDSVGLECGRRVFWSAYVLDKYLSIMFGRPQLLHAEDIDQEFPAAINDEDLLICPKALSKARVPKDCLMAALIFHAKLALIVAKASREQYSIQRFSGGERVDKAAAHSREIEAWQAQLPLVLSGAVHISSLIGIFQRQFYVLALARCHAMMLVNRPLLILNNSKNQSSVNDNGGVDKCVYAAEEIVDLILSLVQENQFFTAYWYAQYVAFNAVSILYIYLLQLRKGNLVDVSRADRETQASADSLWGELTEHAYLEKVALAHEHLASATARSAPNLRYGVVLDELKREVMRNVESPHTASDHRGQDRNQTLYTDKNPHSGVFANTQNVWPRTGDGTETLQDEASNPNLAQSYSFDAFNDSTLDFLGSAMNSMDDAEFWSNLDSLPLYLDFSANEGI